MELQRYKTIPREMQSKANIVAHLIVCIERDI